MARNRIEELLVQLKFEGSEELRKVASGFRDLGRATTLTDTQIQSARRQINDYAKSLNNSEQALKGQIQALQTLRTQATVGGNVYSQLANDVTRLSKTLKGLEEDYKAVGRASEQTDRQIANQFPARRPEAFRVQIAALRRELDGLSVSARAYGDQLTQITIRETAFGRAQARQGVIAGAQAVGAPLIGSMTPQQALPNTTAALRLRLTELRDDLQNTDYALNDYKNTLKEIEVVQKELDRVIGDANKTRKEEIRDRIANLKAINEENAALRQQSAVAGSIARNRAGKEATAGRGLSGAMFGPQGPSEMFRSIGAIIDQPALNTAELMGRTYGEVAQQIRSVAASSDGSINSLQRQRAAWQQLRTTISPLSADYGKVAKEADQAMAAIDRQMQRMQGRRRMSATEATQAAGAVISGGIFGGPEGAIGGIAGTIAGGVPGAFAGAAIGAQVGMIRQQLGATAEYAASIGKLQIALRGVVGSQSAYDQAIRAAAAATRDLNIPQEEATRGLTRLSAAVIGAGGSVADSTFAFRAISEAIKATGGNAEQVDGALLALTQVFSKGKVSAEELNQIAERLPGTFTLFAQAAGKTGPELQKALQQGQVGLNDLMKFLALAGDRYRDTAAAISSSSQDAGARLTVAFQAMRLEVGKSLQPLGAEFQEAFTAFIKDITPAVVGSAKALAAALSFFADNKAAAGLATFALQLGAVALAIKGLQAAFAGIVAMNLASVFTGVASKVVITGSGAAAATPQVLTFGAALRGLFGVAKSLLALGIITITVDVIINNFKRLANLREEIAKLRGENVVGPAGPMPDVEKAAYRFAGASRETVAAAQRKQQKYVAKLRKDLKDLEVKASAVAAASAVSGQGRQASTILSDERTLTALRIKRAEEVLDLNVQNFRTEAEIEKARQAAFNNKFASPAGEDPKAASEKAARDAEAAAAEQQRYLESFMQQQIRVADTVFQHQRDLDRQRFDLLKELTDVEAQNRINKLFGPEREAANIQERRRQRTLEYENRVLAAMNAVAAAQQKFSSAQQMAAVTAGAGLPIATGAAGLPGSISGRLDASGQNGADMPVGVDNAIKSYHDGVVKSLGTAGRNGNYIVVNFIDDLGNLLEATYSHVAAMVKVGDSVVGGQTIGRFDASGRTTGPHNSIDINSPGTNGALQRNRETAAARRSADRLVRGRVQGRAGGRQATGVAAQQRRNVTDTGDVALAGLDVKQAQASLANVIELKERFKAAFDNEQVNALTAAFDTQNNELEKTIILETQRFDLVLKGYSDERIALQQKFDQARILRDAALTGVSPGDETQVLAINTAYERQIVLLQQLYDAQTQFNNSFGAGFQTGVQQYVQSLGTMNQAAAQLTQTGLKGIEDTLFSLVTTGTANFREFAAEILKQSARMILQLTIQRVIMQILGAIGGGSTNLGSSAANVAQYAPLPNAMGNAFASNNIVPYANGGIVNRPTMFKFARGGAMATGVMGEAGPEAIMPLKRGADGKLGVASAGGSNVTVNVSVDAKGTQVQGDPGQGAQLGRVIAGAVQQELIKQQRPGGLLAGAK